MLTGFSVVENWMLIKFLDCHCMGINFVSDPEQIILHPLHILNSQIKPLHHLLHHIFNLSHTIPIFPVDRFPILLRNIMPNPIIVVAIAVTVFVVIVILVPT